MDIEKLLRRCRHALGKAELPLRPDEELDFFAEGDMAGEQVMLDTCVYIDQMQGRLPGSVAGRVEARTSVHSPIVLGELGFLFGNLDPRDAMTTAALAAIKTMLSAIGEHRIMPMTSEDMMRGMILSGCVARLLNHQGAARRKIQNDAILAAHAARTGNLLVTRNVADFDRLSQLEPRLKVSFYRLGAA
jgi:predicted nucleic acid-binding protein